MKELTNVFEREDPRTMEGVVGTMTRESDKHVQRMKRMDERAPGAGVVVEEEKQSGGLSR